ncbi:MAG: hypothetical protein D8M57_14260 [Candidatus Scalindua sp. AMX11]|nr:MAG: hypothetical protein D8M57_14260 [Candidatus Scalindua sp. AMX11]
MVFVHAIAHCRLSFLLRREFHTALCKNNPDGDIYSSQIGFRFSDPDFTRPLDLSQSKYPRLDSTKALVLFNRKIKISGKLLPRNSKNQFAMSKV